MFNIYVFLKSDPSDPSEMNILLILYYPWRIHGAAIYGNMDPINIPPMLAI